MRLILNVFLWKMHCEKIRHYLLAQSEYTNYFRVPKTSERSERVDFQNLYFGSIQRKVTQTNRNFDFFRNIYSLASLTRSVLPDLFCLNSDAIWKADFTRHRSAENWPRKVLNPIKKSDKSSLYFNEFNLPSSLLPWGFETLLVQIGSKIQQ